MALFYTLYCIVIPILLLVVRSFASEFNYDSIVTLSSNACNQFTINQCQLEEEQVLNKYSQITEEECQTFCLAEQQCEFYQYRQNNGSCIISSLTFKEYVSSCMEAGGPLFPVLTDCYEESDPCNKYLEGSCHYEGDLVDTISDVASATMCQVAFEDAANGQYFLYTGEDEMCYLVDSPRRSCDISYGPQKPTFEECLNPTTSPESTTNPTMPTTATTDKSTTEESTSTISTAETTTKNSGLKILAVGGQDVNDMPLTDVEFFNPFSSTNNCVKKPDFPSESTFLGCGDKYFFIAGENEFLDYTPVYELVDNAWIERNAIGNQRYSASCAVLTNNSFWVVGGGTTNQINQDKVLRSSEILIKPEDQFIMSQELPEDMKDQCMSKINSTHFFIGGTYYNWRNAYVVNTADDEFVFTQLPTMTQDRQYAACGSFITDEGNDLSIIVAGGAYAYGLPTSEIFSFKTNEWKNGPTLPRGFGVGGYFSDEQNPLILVGGFDDRGDPQTNVIHYVKDSNTFELLPANLNIARDGLTVTGVYDDEDC